MKLIIIAGVLLTLSLPGETTGDQPTPSIRASGNLTSTTKKAVAAGSSFSGNRTIGETAEDPHIIPGIPFVVTDNTCAYRNDYSDGFPHADPRHDAPDVVYALTPMFDQVVTIDLYDAGFATRIHLHENDIVPGGYTRCNDGGRSGNRIDFCSMIEGAFLSAGNTYYFIVDGCGSACGTFTLRIRKHENRSVRSSPRESAESDSVRLISSPLPATETQFD